MPIRNPFSKKPDLPPPGGLGLAPGSPPARQSFQQVDTVGSRTSSILSLSSGKSQEPVEYKMSGENESRLGLILPEAAKLTRSSHAVVNDSGVYLPVSHAH